jgi:hypothetical protein
MNRPGSIMSVRANRIKTEEGWKWLRGGNDTYPMIYCWLLLSSVVNNSVLLSRSRVFCFLASRNLFVVGRR